LPLFRFGTDGQSLAEPRVGGDHRVRKRILCRSKNFHGSFWFPDRAAP